MTGKKLALLAVFAVAAAVLAAPAGASALMFNYEGKGIEKSKAISLSGTLNWVTPSSGAGIDCSEVTTKLDVETVDAKVTDVEIKTEKCEGTGPYKGCKVTGDTKTLLPWTVIPTEKAMDYLLGSIDYEITCGSTVNKTSVSFETLVGTVDSPSAIKTETVSGSGTSGGGAVTFSGEFKVLGEAAGKLSIVE